MSIILFFSSPCDPFILFYKSDSPLFYFSVRRMSSLFYFVSPSVQIFLFSVHHVSNLFNLVSSSVQIFLLCPVWPVFYFISPDKSRPPIHMALYVSLSIGGREHMDSLVAYGFWNMELYTTLLFLGESTVLRSRC